LLLRSQLVWLPRVGPVLFTLSRQRFIVASDDDFETQRNKKLFFFFNSVNYDTISVWRRAASVSSVDSPESSEAQAEPRGPPLAHVSRD
jgi:hypothetical protein